MKNNDWLKFSGIGTQIVFTLFICWWLGMKIGQYFEFEPWGSVSGVFFGVLVSMYELWKIIFNK